MTLKASSEYNANALRWRKYQICATLLDQTRELNARECRNRIRVYSHVRLRCSERQHNMLMQHNAKALCHFVNRPLEHLALSCIFRQAMVIVHCTF